MKIVFLLILQFSIISFAQTLTLPPRASGALKGSELVNLLQNMSLTDRENEIYAQVLSGNIPDFQRDLIPINFNQTIAGTSYEVKYFVLSDYLAIGSDSDYFLIPTTPILAQKLCNKLKCTLPTRKMVDQIWSNAPVKLAPYPIAPSAAMTTIPVMWQHNQAVWLQRQEVINTHPLGTLVGGDKKDVVISNKIYGNPAPNRVVIYGWHYQNGSPIQPLYSGHEESYADYSHGIRFVFDSISINGIPNKITTILKDNILYPLFSDEGRIAIPYYPLTTSSINPPTSWGVFTNNANSLNLVIGNNPDVTHYIAFLSGDGEVFNNSILLDKNNLVIENLQSDSLYFIKLKAVGIDTSNYSEVLAAVPSETENICLIVNGFDRSYTGNTYDFIRQHAFAIKNNGKTFNSATNEAITSGLLNLANYKFVDWILGTESTANETFSSSEQSFITNYLNNGGTLFTSGSEIAWDLDYKGSTTDKNFIWNYLKAKYILDAPSNLANTYYKAEGVAETVFSGVNNINFDNGVNGTYNVSYPDVIEGMNGGINSLKYTGLLPSAFAGVSYKGLFPNGNSDGGVIYFGFPFETIYPESKRDEVMGKVISYFSDLTGITENGSMNPNNYILFQNYPNPFNPATIIKFYLPNSEFVTLKIYDVLGNEIITLVNKELSQGFYSKIWNADGLSSGVYFYKLQSGKYIETKKMILMR